MSARFHFKNKQLNDRSWHKADDSTQTQTSITYLLRMLCPSLASNQTVCLEVARVENMAHFEPLESEARYSLIISLHVAETDVDLLTPVQPKVDTLIASQIEMTS